MALLALGSRRSPCVQSGQRRALHRLRANKYWGHPVGLESVTGGDACRGRPPEGPANSRATVLISSHRSLGLGA